MKVKKWLSLLLCLLSVAAVFSGCTPTDVPLETTEAAPLAHVLSVGFGRADITPLSTLPLGGLGSAETRFFDDVRDPLYATCIAFTDENDNTIIFFSIEALYGYDAFKFGASDISKATGVPFGNIMIGTTHNHSAPDYGQPDASGMNEYCKLVRAKMVEAAQQALADRKPATMHITTAYPENLNSIRHYLMDDGSYAGDNFGSFSGGRKIVKHVREVDNALQLVKFVREDGKDIIMMNWQGHPRGHDEYRFSVLSFSGKVAESVEQKLDCHCMYVLGASGNVNNSSRIKEEKLYTKYEDHAAALADYVVAAANTYKEAAVGNVQIMGQSVECTPKNGTGSTKVGVSVNAFSIGDVAVVTAPYEMYCENGEAVKDKSPFEMTFVSSCANGRGSYIPSISTYDYNNMPDEVYGIGKTEYAPGTAEILENAFVEMLNTLYKTK